MRSLFLLMTTLLFAAVPALAQEMPKAEVFGAYQYQSLNAGAQIALSTNTSALTFTGKKQNSARIELGVVYRWGSR